MVKRKRSDSSYGSNKRARTGQSSRDIAIALSRMRETKFHLPTINNTGISTSGTLFSLVGMNQGTGRGERVGDKIYVKGLRLNYIAENEEADYNNLMRVCVIRALKSNFALSDCPVADEVTPWDQSKVQVLYDKTHYMRNQEVEAGEFNSDKHCRTINLPIRAQTKFSGTTGLHGEIFIFVRSDSGAITHPAFSFGATVWFTDV